MKHYKVTIKNLFLYVYAYENKKYLLPISSHIHHYSFHFNPENYLARKRFIQEIIGK